jgi:regulator of chromosome condensation
MARSTRLINTTRRTMHRHTTYLSVPSYLTDNTTGGQVLAVGENGMTQLGLKSVIDQRRNPQPVPFPESIVQIAAGPLHSVCLTNQNSIYTFGCNDEHALGRPDIDDNNNDNDTLDPFGEVDLSRVMNPDEEQIVQIVAGDSHTLILSDVGKVYGRSN